VSVGAEWFISFRIARFSEGARVDESFQYRAIHRVGPRAGNGLVGGKRSPHASIVRFHPVK